MKGYWKDLQATEKVIKGGWLYTGDLAVVDNEGYIYIKGRKTDIIKYMGQRISPVEIENVVNSHKCVKESAAIESTIDQRPVIKTYVVLEEECSIKEIKQYVHSRLPLHMRPGLIEIIDELPKTNSGKIKRNILRNKLCVEENKGV